MDEEVDAEYQCLLVNTTLKASRVGFLTLRMLISSLMFVGCGVETDGSRNRVPPGAGSTQSTVVE